MEQKIEGINIAVFDEEFNIIGNVEVTFSERINTKDSYDENSVKLLSLNFLREIKRLIEK